MAYNTTNNNGRGVSKSTTSEEQNTKRREAKAKQKRGTNPNTKNPQTAPTLMKEFKPETIRTKSAALLQAPYTEQMTAAFRKSIHMPADELFDLIWSLTYRPESDTTQLLKVLDLSPEMVSDLPMLLKELAAQYRIYVDPSFMLEPDIDIDAIKQAFAPLYGENHAAALFIYEKCTMYFLYKKADQIDRATYLLSQEADKLHCGGIQEILQEKNKVVRGNLTEFLKPWHEKIYNLFKAMADVKAAEEKSAKENASTPASDSPLANLDKLCAKAGFTLVGATDLKKVKPTPASQQEPKAAKVLVTTQVTEEDNSPKDFSYATVASHYELFNSMAVETALLKELGIDPYQILLNLDAVRKFLAAATQLEDAGFSPCQYPDKEAAIAMVLKAEAARKDAEQLFT